MHRFLFIYQFPKSNALVYDDGPSQGDNLLLSHKVKPFGTSTYWLVSLDSKFSPLSFTGLKVLTLSFIGLKFLTLSFTGHKVFAFIFHRTQIPHLYISQDSKSSSLSFTGLKVLCLYAFIGLKVLCHLLFKDYQSLLSCKDYQCHLPFTFQRLSESFVLQRLSMSSALYISKTSMSFVKTIMSSFTF